MTQQQHKTARTLMDAYGLTHAEEAGIQLRNTPAPLYQLLTLCVLFSVPIKADIAVAAARELFGAGMRTPRAMADSSWQDRVDALGRAHYRRYDESTATALGDGAELVLNRYRGDLRRLRDAAKGKPDRIRELLREFPRIGPVGAEIFCREAQGSWPELRPAFDERARATAAELGLPSSPAGLARLVDAESLPRLAAALVRIGLSKKAVDELL
ncbi:endonuclease [Streptomyces lavendulae]|uniref:endonuclease n=1 Tax=Streptomyces lavendulae TaxID=1914 RepID=UPI0024A5B355|nr:endonuclease [Streptomyces lavendulae]GLX17024.1 endonuclease [Streptomyces lavendulae subsp. lavendulae]GLX29531.1 endonuclease [Streptomyces lavendulae subsp. lavendulae]